MERTSKTHERLTRDEYRRAVDGECPDCGVELTPGACGGRSQNFHCSGCGARFNFMGPFGVERLTNRQQPAKESV